MAKLTLYLQDIDYFWNFFFVLRYPLVKLIVCLNEVAIISVYIAVISGLFLISNDSKANESTKVILSSCQMKGEHLTYQSYLKKAISCNFVISQFVFTCLKLSVETLERCVWKCLFYLLLDLRRFVNNITVGPISNYWLWTNKCWLSYISASAKRGLKFLWFSKNNLQQP